MNILSIVVAGLLSVNQIPKQQVNESRYTLNGQNNMQKIYFSTSSSFSNVFEGDRALDDNESTSWVSAKTGKDHWIEVNYGIKRLFTGIMIRPGKKDGFQAIKGFRLQFLYEGQWFDFAKIDLNYKQTKSDMKNGNVFINLGGVEASTFRIYIPNSDTVGGYAAISVIGCYMGSSKMSWFDSRLKTLKLPIKNAVLPDNDANYPNAPRGYRGGRHVGLDLFYYFAENDYSVKLVTTKTEIIAAGDGTIIRADWDYAPMSVTEWKQRSEYTKKFPNTFVKHDFGGRQIWLDHGNGVVTTYNHLSKLDESAKVGKQVKRGERIGWAGNSGLLGEAQGNNVGIHLHFEVWVDGFYLGYGMDAATVKKHIKWIFLDMQ
jgi:hypothetical protein